MKIGMMGGKTSTAGFQALGVETFPVARPEDGPERWKEIDLDSFAVIFVTEPVYEQLGDEIKEARQRVFPVVTVIPAVTGSSGKAAAELRELVEKAVGTDMFFRK